MNPSLLRGRQTVQVFCRRRSFSRLVPVSNPIPSAVAQETHSIRHPSVTLRNRSPRLTSPPVREPLRVSHVHARLLYCCFTAEILGSP